MLSQIRNQVTLPLYEKISGKNTMKYYVKLRKSQYYSRDRLEMESWKKVKALIRHAYNHCPYYTNLFRSIGAVPQDIKDPSDYERIPVLTKDNLRENLEDLVATNFSREEIHRDATGGSTGNHTPFYRDNKCLEIKKAAELRFDSWAGCKPGEKRAFYWPAIQDFSKADTSVKSKIKRWLLEPELMLYAGILDNATLDSHHRHLAHFRPRLMRAFPNPLSIFSKYVLEKGKDNLHIPSIMCVGEPLLPSHRRQFEVTFSSEVFNCYVSRECGNIACECSQHNYLHMNSELLYIEFLNEKPDTPSKIIITDLYNYGMPFIRYQIEDMGRRIEKKCECGINLPLMDIGACRISDFIISPYDKSLISGSSFLHYMIAEGPEVGQIQVIQDAVNHLELRIVRSSNYSQDKLKHFDKVISHMFKGKMNYDITFVDRIGRERSGKYRFVISNVTE